MAPKIVLLSLILFGISGFNIFGEEKSSYITGEGRFYAQDDDSLRFIKKQLVASAFRDVLTKSLQSMNLDSDLFWKNYDEQFEKDFSKTLAALNSKYREGDPKQTNKEKIDLRNAIRQEKLSDKRDFGNISRVVTSYAIKKMTRSPHYPKSRFLSLEAKVDYQLLNKIYRSFIGIGDNRSVKKLYLFTDLEIKGANWDDLGVAKASDFTSVVTQHWKIWLEENLGTLTNKVELVTEEMAIRLDHQYQLPIGSPERAPELEESLWLKINITLDRDDINPLLKIQSYSFTGNLLLIDVKTGNPVIYKSFEPTYKSYNFVNNFEFSSNVASHVYRIPVEELGKLKENIRALPFTMNQRKIVLANVSNYQDVQLVLDILNHKILTIQAQAKTESYSLGKGTIDIRFQGVENELKKGLLGYNKYKSSTGNMMTFPQMDNPYYIVFENGEDVKEGVIEQTKEDLKEETKDELKEEVL